MTLAETIQYSKYNLLWVMIYNKGCSFINDKQTITKSEFLANGPPVETFDIRPNFMRIDLNINKCNKQEVMAMQPYVNLTIQKN
jgi:hypothetical protein